MKRIILLKNIDSSWACQNRVEALEDWSRGGGACPFDIGIEGNNAVITVTSDLRDRYDNDYQYNNDITMLNAFLKDIKDPVEAGDNFEFRDIDMDNSTAEQQDEFSKFAQESIGDLSREYLSVLGLRIESVHTDPKPDNIIRDRMELITKMMNDIGVESSDDTVSKVTEPVIDTTTTTEPTEDKEDTTPTTDTVAVNEQTTYPKTVQVSESEIEFIREFMGACEEYEITPKGLVAVIMSLKALANNTAKAKSIEDANGVSVSDVTGTEEYTYTDAIPYINNPAEGNGDVGTQFVNVGTESINDNVPNGTTPDNTEETISAEDVYASLTNVPTGTIFEDDDTSDVEDDNVEVIHADIGLESFMSKHSNKHSDNNQVVADMKKICEDVKDIAAKSFKELRNRNAELFEKYGSFIKLINDIVDAVFMGKHHIKLEIARFDVQKANDEIVPDKLEESIRKYFGKSLVKAALGPFASLAQDLDSPGSKLLICANKLRKGIVSSANKVLSKYPNTVLTLVEDELKGSYVLTLAFAPLEISNESEEKTYNSLIEQYAFESKSDDEFFQRVIADKDKFTFQEIMDCSEFNMRNFYMNGSKTQNNPAVAAVRRTAYFKN